MSFLGGCTVAWIALAVSFLLSLILSRQFNEYNIMPFNRVGAIVGAILPYVLIISLTGSVKWAFFSAIVGQLALGYAFSLFMGESGGDYDDM